MRIRDIALLCGTAMCLAGCFSFEAAKLSRSGEENVFISNYGWYLFGLWPLATGNAIPDGFPIVFFRDDVTMDKIQARMLSYSESQHKEIDDLTYHNHDSVLLNIPGLDFPLPIPYILTYREIQLSGVVR